MRRQAKVVQPQQDILLMIYILHYLKDLSYGNCGRFLLMGDAGYISSTVVYILRPQSTYAETT